MDYGEDGCPLDMDLPVPEYMKGRGGRNGNEGRTETDKKEDEGFMDVAGATAKEEWLGLAFGTDEDDSDEEEVLSKPTAELLGAFNNAIDAIVEISSRPCDLYESHLSSHSKSAQENAAKALDTVAGVAKDLLKTKGKKKRSRRGGPPCFGDQDGFDYNAEPRMKRQRR